MTDRIQTHWEGCERTHGHSECACRVMDNQSARIAQLEADNAVLKKVEKVCHELWLAAEEYDFPDGLGQGAEQAVWDKLADVFDEWEEHAALAKQEPPK